MDLLIKCNVGPRERLVRLGIGFGAGLAAYLARDSRLRLALGAIGSAGLATATTRYCPVNHALGIDHCQPAYRSVRQLIRRI